jgi:2,4-dienoyl-CoA reductase-like NADH-dependent reductase (Old Yellow Enzyme family)
MNKTRELVTDAELENAGLVKITAFVRSPQSEAAKRKAKQRDKEQAEGLKQINLKAHTADHELIKQLAAELKTANEEQKKLLSEIIANLKNQAAQPKTVPTPVTSPKKVTGLKSFILKVLLKLIALMQ